MNSKCYILFLMAWIIMVTMANRIFIYRLCFLDRSRRMSYIAKGCAYFMGS